MARATVTAKSVTIRMTRLLRGRFKSGCLLGFMDHDLALWFLRLRWRPRLDELIVCPHRVRRGTARHYEAPTLSREPGWLLMIWFFTSGWIKLCADVSRRSRPMRQDRS